MYTTTWSIQDFPLLMEEISEGNSKEALRPNILLVPLNSSDTSNKSRWTIKCWPHVRDQGARILLRLHRIRQLSFSSSSSDEWLNVTAAIKLLNCLGQKELLDEVSGWFDDGSDVLDVYVSLERLRHGRMNYKKTPNPKCRLFLKIDLLMDFEALCLTDFIDWKYIHSWLYFQPNF
jgi:hypothetical protein